MKVINLVSLCAAMILFDSNLFGQDDSWHFKVNQSFGEHYFAQQAEVPSVRTVITPNGIANVALLSKQNNPHWLSIRLSDKGNTGNTLCNYNTTSYSANLLIGKSDFDIVLGYHQRTYNSFYYTSDPIYSDYSESNTVRSLSLGLRNQWAFNDNRTIFGFLGLSGEVNLQHQRKDNMSGLISDYNYNFPNQSLKPLNATLDAGMNFKTVYGDFDVYLKYLVLNPFNPAFLDDLGSQPYLNRKGGKLFLQFGKQIKIPKISLEDLKTQLEKMRNSSSYSSIGIKIDVPIPHFSVGKGGPTNIYNVKTPNGSVALTTAERDPLVIPIAWLKPWANIGLTVGQNSSLAGVDASIEHTDMSQCAGSFAVKDSKIITTVNKAYALGSSFRINTFLGSVGVKYAYIYHFNQSQFIGDENFNEYAQIIPTQYYKHNLIYQFQTPLTGPVLFNYMPINYLKSDLPFYKTSVFWMSLELGLYMWAQN
jgi:hypothetical protein